MTCIRSSTGSIAFLTLGFLAIAMPTGRPTIKQRSIPIKTIVVVSIALSQKRGFRKPIEKIQKPTKIVVPIFFPLAK